MSKKGYDQGDIEKLYEPDYFYEHGDNPAHKKFMEIAKANLYDGALQEDRAAIIDNKGRFLPGRNFEDFLQRDFKIYTAPRALAVLATSTLFLGGMIGMSRRLVPIGKFGITRMNQTHFYHKFGRYPTLAALSLPYLAFYAWFKVASFCGRRIWNNVVLQEREWFWERQRRSFYGDYYFKDTPLSENDYFPDLARVELAKTDPLPDPEWATK